MNNRLFLIRFSLLALLAGGLAACGNNADNTQKTQTTTALPVQVATATLADMPRHFEFAATVAATDRVNLATRLMGQITYMEVEEGQKVTQGQVLARIRSNDLQAKQAQAEAGLAEARAALANAQKDHERISRLFAKQSATQKELDDITAHYAMAQARVTAATQMQQEVREMLGYAEIRAPFNGVVAQKMAQVGDMANPGMPLLVVESVGGYKVVAKVPEREIAQLQAGDAVAVRIEALGTAALTARVDQVNPSGAYRGGQFEVTALLQPTAEQAALLKSGMYASLMVQKGSEKRIMVPETALVQRGQLEGLYAVNQQGEAMLRWVKTGKRLNGQVEILSGLGEGEQYIASHEGKLTDGLPVQAVASK